tara:strand:+ start:7290 stop:8480 length:1191 start_codon:yes stop_codon:yes gene_type:complete
MRLAILTAGLLAGLMTGPLAAQTVVFEGSRNLLPTVLDSLSETYMLDLDAGMTGIDAQTNGDLVLVGPVGSEALRPANGARLVREPSTGTDYAGCNMAPMRGDALDARDLARGDRLCVRTNLGNVASVEVIRPLSSRTPVLVLDVTTWEETPLQIYQPRVVAQGPSSQLRLSCSLIGLGAEPLLGRFSIIPDSDGEAIFEMRPANGGYARQGAVPSSWRDGIIRLATGDMVFVARAFPKSAPDSYGYAGRYGVDGENSWAGDCEPETAETALQPLLDTVREDTMQVVSGSQIDFSGGRGPLRRGNQADLAFAESGLGALGNARISYFHPANMPRAEDCGEVVGTGISADLLQVGSWFCVRLRGGRLAVAQVSERSETPQLALTLRYGIYDDRSRRR